MFQGSIEAKCRSEEEMAAEVRRVICHEIAHNFGIADESLWRIERKKLGKRGRR